MSANALQLTDVPTMQTGMGIRRPPRDVFRAFVDPTVTTKFWFTRSSGPLEPGVTVEWVWEMYDVSAKVAVKEVEADRRIVFDWGDGASSTTVEFRFTGWGDDRTFVEVTETGFAGTGDEVAARVADSTGGFTIALCAAKAWLEHDIVLAAVRDRFPRDLEQ
jgi:uncharacterized protein YndB with AHSA1/START domain